MVTTSVHATTRQHKVVIVGAGTGGVTVAARLLKAHPGLDIAVVDPASEHFYQPAWTLVGGGTFSAEATRRLVRDVLPKGTVHIQSAVTALHPDENRVELDDGVSLQYEFLVVAAGIENQWDAIEGLREALGNNGVTSNYRYDLAPYTWQLVQSFVSGGTAIFTQPAGAIKCPGAPQKALYLSADYFRRHSIGANLQFRSGAAGIFGVPFYAPPLNKIMADYGAQAHYNQRLVAVRGDEQIAVFEYVQDGETVVEEVAYDLLHVVPPQTAPAFIRNSVLADDAGWLEVDKNTLVNTRFTNVFGLGDCTSTPNSKTAAAIKNQAPVLAENLLAAIEQKAATASYDGYAGCPLTVTHNKVLLAEFTYGGVVSPSFPADPRVPRRFYGWLKQRFLPWFYWNTLLKGKNAPDWHKQRDYS